MSVPFPLSDEFGREFAKMQAEIRTLKGELDLARADLGRLTDRTGKAADAFALSTFMLPAQVDNGSRFSVQVTFNGEFNPNNWGVDWNSGPQALRFLRDIEADKDVLVL